LKSSAKVSNQEKVFQLNKTENQREQILDYKNIILRRSGGNSIDRVNSLDKEFNTEWSPYLPFATYFTGMLNDEIINNINSSEMENNSKKPETTHTHRFLKTAGNNISFFYSLPQFSPLRPEYQMFYNQKKNINQ